MTQSQSGRFWLYIIAAVASLGGFLPGYDMGIISGALTFINKTWTLSAFLQGWIVSAALIGSIIGAGGNGVLADIFGRKRIILLTAVIFIIGSVLSAMASTISLLITGRLIVGAASGMITLAIPLYLSEIAPKNIRGILVSMFQLSLTAGILVSYFMNGYFANSDHNWNMMLLGFAGENADNWRGMLGSEIYPTALLLAGIFLLPETPMWLISKKRISEAQKVFERIEPGTDGSLRTAEILNTLKGESVSSKQLYVFRKWMWMPLLVGVGMMFIQIGTGINTIIYYAPTVFHIAGFNAESGALYATIGVGAVNFLMTIVAIGLVDKIGRKPLLYFGLAGMFAGMLLLGATFYFAPVLGGALKWMAVGSILLYVAAFGCSIGPVGWIMVSEILPMQIRGPGMSVCTVSNFGINFIVVLTFLPLLQSVGEAWTFWIYALIIALCFIFVYFLVPETKGISLAKIEKNWIDKVPAREF